MTHTDNKDLYERVIKLKNTSGQSVSEKLSNYKYAIYRAAWTLTKPDRKYLDRFFLKWTTASLLYQNLSDEHDWKDQITNAGFNYELCYINCSLAYLEELADSAPNKLVMLSFRCKYSPKLAYCLVRVQTDHLTEEAIKEASTELEF